MSTEREVKELRAEVERLKADVTAMWQQIINLGGVGRIPPRPSPIHSDPGGTGVF